MIAEELGLAGVLVVLGAFAALLFAGVRIALRTRQRFAMLLAFGMTALLAVPAVLNGAVVMGLVPTKGLTLPLLSYGRSSILASCLALGVLLGIGRREARGDAGADRQGHAARGGAVSATPAQPRAACAGRSPAAAAAAT